MKRKKDPCQIHIGRVDALMVIDMNNDTLLPDGNLFIRGIPGEPNPQELIGRVLRINSLPFGFRLMVTESRRPGHIEFSRFPKHNIEGTPGQKWSEQLNAFVSQADFSLTKGMEQEIFSLPLYTSRQFFDLIPALRARHIERIFGAGIAFDKCLGESIIALSLQGFKCFVIRDACRSVPPPNGDADKMKKKLELYGVREISSTNLL